MYLPKGRHATLDGWNAAPAVLADGEALAEVMTAAAKKAGASVRNRFVERLPPGVSVAVVLAESHATIHTYPECGAYMADVFTCGDVDPATIAKALATAVGGTYRLRLHPRGQPRWRRLLRW